MPQAGTAESSMAGRFARFRKRSRPEVLYTFSFSTTPPDTSFESSGYTLVPADRERLRELRRAFPRELSKHKLQLLVRRLREPGQRCWLIIDGDGAACGYCHIATTSTLNARINHMVKIAPHQAYFYDDFVFNAHRGKGLHAFSIARRRDIAAAEGITEALTTIAKKNSPSLASYGKFALRPRFTLIYLPALGRTLRLPRRR